MWRSIIIFLVMGWRTSISFRVISCALGVERLSKWQPLIMRSAGGVALFVCTSTLICILLWCVTSLSLRSFPTWPGAYCLWSEKVESVMEYNISTTMHDVNVCVKGWTEFVIPFMLRNGRVSCLHIMENNFRSSLQRRWSFIFCFMTRSQVLLSVPR